MLKPYEVKPIDIGYWRHYKGGLYKVTGTSLHTETSETMVDYHSVQSPYQRFCRPHFMWEEMVEVGGKQVPRFDFLGDTAEEALDSLNVELMRLETECDRCSPPSPLKPGSDSEVVIHVPMEQIKECVLAKDKLGLHGSNDCTLCKGNCFFERTARESFQAVVHRHLPKPEQMHGAGDQFPGSDYDTE